MKNTILEKLKSPVVWVAVIAQIAVLVGLFIPDLADEVKIIGGSVVEVLTLFGILNNPNNKTGF